MFNQLRNPNRKDCRMRKFATLGMLLIFAGVAATSLQAESKFTYGGVYTAWAQSQHNFTLTKDAYDHEYVVQMFRLNLRFAANDHLKAVTRFDISQDGGALIMPSEAFSGRGPVVAAHCLILRIQTTCSMWIRPMLRLKHQNYRLAAGLDACGMASVIS